MHGGCQYVAGFLRLAPCRHACRVTHFYKLGQPGKKCRPFSFKHSVILVTGDDEKSHLKKIWWEKLILGDDQGVMSRDMGWRFLIFCSILNDGLGI